MLPIITVLHASTCHLSHSLGQTDAVGAKVVDRVPSAQEGIAQNDERTSRGRNVKGHERRNTRALHLENVVVRADGEVVAREGERQVRKAVTLLALDSVLAVEALLGTHLLVAAITSR